MIDEEDYWTALAEANRALVEDVVFDDMPIQEELVKSEKCLQGYKDQLATLDIMPLHSTKYNTLVADNENLRQENQKYQADIKQLEHNHAQAIRKAHSINYRR